MGRRLVKDAAPPRPAASRRADTGQDGQQGIERAGERPIPAWSGPFIPYPPVEPPPRTERIAMALRRYGLVGLLLLAVPLVALWLLTSGEAEPELKLSAEEWAQVSGTYSPAGAAGTQSGLSILTYPAGAEVRLDFDSIGVTPVDRHALAAGTYLLSVAKDGYLTYDTLLTVESGESPRLHLLLQPWGDVGRVPAQVRRAEERGASAVPPDRRAGSEADRGGLRVTSQAQDATVWLDGRHVGETPLSLDDLSAGPHTVEVRTEDGQAYVEDVAVEPGVVAVVQAAFPEEVGGLTVLVRPWGSIYIDGRLHRQDTDVQYEVELPVGTHWVRVEHPVLGSATQEVNVVPGASQRLVIDLNAPPGGGAVDGSGE